MKHIEFNGTWHEIWEKKGAQAGGKEDALEIGGWTNTITSADEIAKKLVEFLEIEKDSKVLEIGCGAGGLAQYMNCNYIGIDYSDTSAKKCMEFFQKPAITCEANKLPFADNYFDVSFAYGCFFYFPSLDYAKMAVEEMKRVTKGKIFIGELPRISHNEHHLLFSEQFFENMGMKTMKGWAKPYTEKRFSAFL